MSKEREILQKILTAYREDKSCMSWGVANEIQELLAQPEQDKVDFQTLSEMGLKRLQLSVELVMLER